MGNLTENDFQRVADLLGIEVAVVKAVQAVETGGHGGFVAPGRPMILFEGHIFWRELKKRGLDPERYVAGNENILYPKWEKCPVNLKSIPRYVNHVRLNPKEVDYLIEQRIKFND